MTRTVARLFGILLLISSASCSFLSSVFLQEAAKPAEKSIPLAVGNHWTYRLHIPKEVHLIVDPHFVRPNLSGTSITNGVLVRARGPEESTFTMKCVQVISDSSCRIEVEEEGLRLWFINRTTEQRLVMVSHDSFLTFELHGVSEIGKDRGDPWIMGQALALVPVQANQAKGDLQIWRSGVVEPLRDPIRVPAGEFGRGFHSTIARREPSSGLSENQVPDYTIESWTASGVGLVKYVMRGPGGDVMFVLELANYEVK